MRVLHVTPTYYPALRYGGPITSTHGLCEAIAKLGHEVQVYTTNLDGDKVLDVPTDRSINVDGVQVRYFRCGVRRVVFSHLMSRALRREITSFDCVHTHGCYLWPGVFAGHVARRAGVPYIVTPRGVLVRHWVEQRGTARKLLTLDTVERRRFAQAAAIHFTSSQEFFESRWFRLPTPRPTVIPNGVRLPPDAPQPTARGRHIAYLGRLSWEKGLDQLIDALPNLPTTTLQVAGIGDTEYLRKLSQTAGVSDRVVYRGELRDSAKWQFLREAAALVVPSRYENFGNVVVEALAVSTPTVVSAGVGAAEIVRSARAGAVVQSSPEGLSQGIARLLNHPQRAAEAGERGQRYVENHLSWPAVAQSMVALYQNLRRAARQGSR